MDLISDTKARLDRYDEEYEVTVEAELDELTAQTTFKVLAGEEEEPTSTEEQGPRITPRRAIKSQRVRVER